MGREPEIIELTDLFSTRRKKLLQIIEVEGGTKPLVVQVQRELVGGCSVLLVTVTVLSINIFATAELGCDCGSVVFNTDRKSNNSFSFLSSFIHSYCALPRTQPLWSDIKIVHTGHL